MSKARRWVVAIAATLAMAVSYFDRQALGALAPVVKESLRVSNERYGWLVSAFSIAYLVASPLAGQLVDRVGARRGLVGAVLMWTVVAALHSLAPGFAVLFALRIALGVAEAPSFPGAAQTVQRVMPPESRPRAFGLLFTGSSLGALTAPIAASYFADRFGWRSAFLVTAALGLAWVPLWIAVTRGAPVTVLLGRAEHAPERSSVGANAIVSTVFHPAVLRAGVIVAASAPAVSFVFNWGSSYLHDIFSIAQRDVGHYLWLPPLLFDLGALAFGYLASVRRSAGAPPRVLMAVAGVIGASLCFTNATSSPWTAVIVMGVSLAGIGGLFAMLTADMLGRVDPKVISTASGTTAAVQSLAYVISNPLVGRARDASGGYHAQILILGAIIVPGVLIWILWPAHPPWRALAEGDAQGAG